MWPASLRIGGTSGSETKFCQPSASQSNSTHTRSSSLGSRKTCEPLDPCCSRFAAPLVEKILTNWSKSSTFVVARIILSSVRGSVSRGRATKATIQSERSKKRNWLATRRDARAPRQHPARRASAARNAALQPCPFAAKKGGGRARAAVPNARRADRFHCYSGRRGLSEAHLVESRS